MPPRETPYTQEGTLAHELCERKLRALLYGEQAPERVSDEEMEEYTDGYAAFVMGEYEEAKRIYSADAKIYIERQLNLSEFVPECGGTADALIVADRLIEVIDFKYGKGVQVSALTDEAGTDGGNPQMKLYALGAYAAHSYAYVSKDVKMVIYQPRLGNVSTKVLSITELRAWANDTLVPAARKAMLANSQPVAGAHCHFCLAKGQCTALRDLAQRVSAQPCELLSKEEIAKTLPLLAVIQGWCESFKAFSLDMALKGERFSGYKLVEGRSNRMIADEDALAQRLIEANYVDIYRPKALRNLTELEKLCGKKNFAAIAKELIYKPAGAPALVPVSDKRAEYNSAKNDFANINN